MAVATKPQTRYTKAPIKKKTKMGGIKVVSSALVKEGSTNLTPKIHVRQGDLVMLIQGTRKNRKFKNPEHKQRAEERNAYAGSVGKVLAVYPEEGKIVVEGVNMVTRATKSRNPMAKSGQVTREGKIFASKVMLYCPEAKKATRVSHKEVNGKKVRYSKKYDEVI